MKKMIYKRDIKKKKIHKIDKIFNKQYQKR